MTVAYQLDVEVDVSFGLLLRERACQSRWQYQLALCFVREGQEITDTPRPFRNEAECQHCSYEVSHPSARREHDL